MSRKRKVFLIVAVPVFTYTAVSQFLEPGFFNVMLSELTTRLAFYWGALTDVLPFVS